MRLLHGGVHPVLNGRVYRRNYSITCTHGRYRCRSTGEQDEEPLAGPPRQDATAVGEKIMRLLAEQDADQDALVQYLPDAVIDAYISRRKNIAVESKEEDDDENVFQTCVAHAPSGEFQINSYSWRGLLFAPPLQCDLMSTLQVSNDRYMQRYFVVSQHGEEMTISLDFRLEDTLKSRYRGLTIETHWFLYGMAGEPVHAFESTLDSRLGPESVVEAQLHALKEQNIQRVFLFASPRNKKIFDNDIAKFEAMLRTPAYQSLLGHRESKVLKSVQSII